MSHVDEHGHSHDHSHGVDESYYVDQLCLVALSLAFGSICLALYFWQTEMLVKLLGPQFHLFILGSGVALVVLSVTRAAMLWMKVGQTADHDHSGHDHSHETHDHGHDHTHGEDGCCGHDHEHETAVHAHKTVPLEMIQVGQHGPLTTTVAGHSHGHEDHDHGWAPWRYVVLMPPVILTIFLFLGLLKMDLRAAPNVVSVTGDMSKDIENQAQVTVTLVALGPLAFNQLATLPAVTKKRQTGPAVAKSFGELEAFASHPTLRAEWTGRMVSVKGQFVPNPNNQHIFSLGRFRIQCCAADAVQLNVPIVSKELIDPRIKPNDWILVKGEVSFYQAEGRYHTMLQVHSAEDVAKSTPDNDPYIR